MFFQTVTSSTMGCPRCGKHSFTTSYCGRVQVQGTNWPAMANVVDHVSSLFQGIFTLGRLVNRIFAFSYSSTLA
jgi:RNA polymerase subunit RPABC4/transcription elongation factor Spt4